MSPVTVGSGHEWSMTYLLGKRNKGPVHRWLGKTLTTVTELLKVAECGVILERVRKDGAALVQHAAFPDELGLPKCKRCW